MFSQTLEYALRAVVCLAQHHGESLTARQMARLTRVPAGYLSKVLQSLAKAGIVRSQRGLHGGFVLAMPPDQLTILRVLNEVDPMQRITRCPLNIKHHGTRLCTLHRKLDDAMGIIEEAFGGTTIAQVLNSPSQSTPLCDLEAAVVVGSQRRKHAGKEH